MKKKNHVKKKKKKKSKVRKKKMIAKSSRESCHICKKKLNLIPLQCKCGFFFCNNHYFFENHNCSYNYKKEYDSNLLLNCKTIKSIPKI